MFVLPDLYNTANTVTELFDGSFPFYSVDPIAPVKFDVHNTVTAGQLRLTEGGLVDIRDRMYIYHRNGLLDLWSILKTDTTVLYTTHA